MNILPATVTVRDGVAFADISDAQGQLQSLQFSQTNLTSWGGKEILLGIRPEAITDVDGADRKSQNIQRFSNVVTVTEPAGSDTFVTMTVSGRDVVARMRADASVAARDRFEFAVNMDKAVVFDPKTEARIP